MLSDANNYLFADLLGDCFAECEEHLAQVRRNLLALEPFVNQPPLNRTLLNETLRCFHSLKGLSGMIGAKAAEELAHQMESYLKALRDKQVELTALGFDALLEGTQTLEGAIASHRDQTPLPALPPTISQLTAGLQPQQIPPNELKLSPEESKQLAEARERGETAWHIIFTPNATRAERGINVNSIRSRLQAIGDLRHAAPRMTPGTGIAFDFVITSTRDAETTFAGWEQDGLTWSPYGGGEPPQSPIPTLEAVSPDSPPPPMTQSVNIVRVDLLKLDELMRMVGDLTIGRDRLADNLTHLKGIVPVPILRPLLEANLALERQLRALREGVMHVRLVPIAEIFARMQFALRELVRETQKQVVLELSGQETEIDKFLVERMMDPLLHLVRNAVSHGIEPAAERQRIGKPSQGKISLRAAASGEMVIICIEDDGSGIDSETVLSKARSLGLLAGESIDQTEVDSALILDILCSPGFSTREVADLTSGRGVGMAIVKNTVQELGGFMTLETQVGSGTRFTIQLPLTLVIVQALILNAGGQTFAIPQSAVREVIEVPPQTLTLLENYELLPYRGNVLPLFHLSRLLNLNKIEPNPSGIWETNEAERAYLSHKLEEAPQRINSPETPEKNRVQPPPTSSFSQGEQPGKSPLRALVIGSGLKAVGIVVERIVSQREIVVRAITDPLLQVFGIAGATELGDGRVVLILDASALEQSTAPLNFQTPKKTHS